MVPLHLPTDKNALCPELQAVLDEYHKPVVIQDEVLGELKLDKDYNTFEGEIQWCGTDVYLSLEVNAESKPSWTRARSAAKKLLADCETWDKAMRELAAKNLTGLANDWLSQDEENPRDPETDPITEEELARRISMTSLSVTSGGSFTVWFDCDEMFTDHAVTVYGSLKKGLKAANIEAIGSRTGIPKRGATVSPRAWKPYGSSCTRRPGMRALVADVPIPDPLICSLNSSSSISCPAFSIASTIEPDV